MHLLRTALLLHLAAVSALGQLVALPSPVQLTPEGRQLILNFEVGGGERYYNRLLARPTWPGFASGVTIGVGYDLGFNSERVIRSDWNGLKDLDRLAPLSGITGQRAKDRVAQIRDILIGWEHANAVFTAVTVTRFYQLCQRTFPGFDDLRPNAQAALVSLVFNRGNAMSGPQRTEMRTIRSLVPKRDYAGIAHQLRTMKRIWKGTDISEGMSRRREAEARLAETP